ncbi:uncharacterized protein [Aristolochia californica]|uniref:uncharacterized protein n=1 Tax=Aristolochia californica TaxID=171875 RepID=UPI0035D7BF17
MQLGSLHSLNYSSRCSLQRQLLPRGRHGRIQFVRELQYRGFFLLHLGDQKLELIKGALLQIDVVQGDKGIFVFHRLWDVRLAFEIALQQTLVSEDKGPAGGREGNDEDGSAG